MRANNRSVGLIVAAVASGCLSETLIDNYDATKVTAGNGGAGGVLQGVSGGLSQFESPSYSPEMIPRFVSVAGGSSLSLPGGKGGAAVTTAGVAGIGSGGATQSVVVAGGSGGLAQDNGGSVAGASAGTAGASSGIAGAATSVTSVPLMRASPNGTHSLARYLAFEFDGVAGYGIKVGTTAADHLIAMISARGVNLASVATGDPPPALLEVSSKGDPLRYVVFQNGRMPDGFAVDPQGSVLLAGKLDRDVSYGGQSISSAGNGYYVAVLDADWLQTFAQGYATDREPTVQGVAWDANGGIHLAVSDERLFVVGLGAGGALQYRWVPNANQVGSASNSSIASLAVDAAGRVRAVGAFDGAMSLDGQGLVSAGARDGWLATWDAATGVTQNAFRLGGIADDNASVITVAPNGHLRVGGTLSGRVELFGETVSLPSTDAPFVCDLDETGHLRWLTLLGDAGTVAAAVQLGARTYVAGHLYGSEPSNPWKGSKLYAAEIEFDGSVSSMFTTDSSGDSVTNLAVDSVGNIWLSGRADLLPYNSPDAVAQDSIAVLQLVRAPDPVAK